MDVSVVQIVAGVATSMVGSVLIGYLPERFRHPRRHARITEVNRAIFAATSRIAESAELFTARDISAVIADMSLRSGISIARLADVKQVIQHHVSRLVSSAVAPPDVRERVEALWALDRRIGALQSGQMRLEDRSRKPAWAAGRALAAGIVAASALLALGNVAIAIAAGTLGAWVVLEAAQRPEQVTDVTDGSNGPASASGSDRAVASRNDSSELDELK